MTRRLTEEEEGLWKKLRETVKPLKARVKRVAKQTARRAEAAPPPEPAKSEGPPKRKPPSSPAPAATRVAQRPAPALAPLEERTLRRLRRGLEDVDARIDLHGMRQERAHAALAHFLRRQQAHGAKVVLVVTGKGNGEGGIGEDRRGVLRQSVPHWLAGPEFRPLVVGVREAHRRHGGAGALYVRIRRRRDN